MSSAFPEECPECGTESTDSSSMGVWCDPCDEYFDPDAAGAAEPDGAVYGPQEATVDDVVAAVTQAGQARYEDPGWRGAWDRADATGDNHQRSVQRDLRTPGPEAGQ